MGCIRVADRLQDSRRVQDIDDANGLEERRAGSAGVYLQNDAAVTLSSLLSIPLTWTHTHVKYRHKDKQQSV